VSNRSAFFLFLIFLCGLTAWRLWPAFSQSGFALGSFGDAAGTTGWIWQVGEQFKQQGFSVFLDGDVMRPMFFGAGLMDPVPVVNPAWRLMYVAVTQLGLAPDNNYDAVIAFQYVLAGIVGWFFAAAFGLRVFWRFVFVFLMLSVENTANRIAGHNGLVFNYGPMLSLIAALKYAQAPSRWRAIGLVLGLWFSFLSNEYFGYFGFWACLTLIVALEWRRLKENPISFITQSFKIMWPAALCMVVLLCLSHPSVTLFQIVAFFERLGESPDVQHSKVVTARATNHAREFLMYGLKNPLAFFESNLLPIPAEVVPKIYGRNPGEFTFRWGLVLPIFVWWMWRTENKIPEKINYKTSIMAVVVVTVLFGLRTDLGISLGWITRLIAPMFRVGVRAHLISLVCMILLFALCAQWLWDQRTKHLGSLKTSLLLVLVTSITAYELARSGPVFGHHSIFPVSPRAQLASKLANYPRGMTLMLPADPSESESYYLSSLHGMPVLNSNLGKLNQSLGDTFYGTAHNPNELSKTRLEACGIRYLIIGNLASHSARWLKVAGTRVIAENSEGAIVELPNALPWPVDLGSVSRDNRESATNQSRQFLTTCAEQMVMLSKGADTKQ
jgi:hypothetical protein